MPNFSGLWTVTQQMQARGASTWPATPGAPTIGTAANAGPTSLTVTFTAPGCTGAYPAGVTGYQAISTPGCFTATGASSPITVTGLTTGTAYTLKVRAQNTNGYGGYSAASNSATPAVLQGQQAYISTGCYSWVAPAGVTSVSVVSVGGGGTGGYSGGGLGWKNNITVIPGNSYTVAVGRGGVFTGAQYSGGNSYFCSAAVVKGCGGTTGRASYVGTGGGGGGSSGSGAGGGAGGYTGAGGDAGSCGNGCASGSGGGGGGMRACPYIGGGGGGVGILGSGAGGAGGTVPGSYVTGGGGGSGGAAGTNGYTTGTGCGSGGLYGGAGGGGFRTPYPTGANGAVRIIWPGTTRSFPSTNTGDL